MMEPKLLVLNENLFNKTAQDWVYKINNKKTSSTQMRIFYEYVLKLYERSEKLGNEADFKNTILPFVKMLNSKVEYAYGREKIDLVFKEMIVKCVEEVENKEQMKLFKLFFEAVLGFAKGREFKEKMERKNKWSKK